jgi:hypothetical protein
LPAPLRGPADRRGTRAPGPDHWLRTESIHTLPAGSSGRLILILSSIGAESTQLYALRGQRKGRVESVSDALRHQLRNLRTRTSTPAMQAARISVSVISPFSLCRLSPHCRRHNSYFGFSDLTPG